MDAKPFLKWAGGKKQLLDTLLSVFPKQADTYFEPFVGGGSVFFGLASAKRFGKAVLNDVNSELINCYRVIRDFPEELMGQVQKLPISEAIFKELRAKDPMSYSPVRRAARTLYLNKTGFNGLYRVNKQGKFNVPWGKYKKPTIYVEENILACSVALNRFVSLTSKDFVDAVREAKAGDLVYFDPPYVELSQTSNFKSYTSAGFSENDHYRLAVCFRELVERGVAVVASNSDTELVREIYKDWEIQDVQAKRSINSKGDSRGAVSELIIIGRGK